MSLPASKAEANQEANVVEYETSLKSHQAISPSNDSDIDLAFAKPPQNRQFLQAPHQWGPPHRPLSPDTLSNLSVDEFEQLRPRSRSPRHELNGNGTLHKFSKSEGWREKLHAMWIRNLGLVYMLCAQVFGCLMNVTTRLLEVEGNKGKGLHPFQVRTRITIMTTNGHRTDMP